MTRSSFQPAILLLIFCVPSWAQANEGVLRADLVVEVTRTSISGVLQFQSSGKESAATLRLPFRASDFQSTGCECQTKPIPAGNQGDVTEVQIRMSKGRPRGKVSFKIRPRVFHKDANSRREPDSPIVAIGGIVEFNYLDLHVQNLKNTLRFRYGPSGPESVGYLVPEVTEFVFAKEIHVAYSNHAKVELLPNDLAGDRIVIDEAFLKDNEFIVEYVVINLSQIGWIIAATLWAISFLAVLAIAFLQWPARLTERLFIYALWSALVIIIGQFVKVEGVTALSALGVTLLAALVVVLVDLKIFFSPALRKEAQKTQQLKRVVIRRSTVRDYLSIELFLSTPQTGQLAVKVANTSAGDLQTQTNLPLYNSDHIRSLSRVIGRHAQPKTGDARPAALGNMGHNVGQALLSDEIRKYFAGIYDQLTDSNGLRICLRLDDDAVVQVPWEIAKYADDFLCLRPATPMIRVVISKRYTPAPRIQGPLRVMGIVSAPSDLTTIDWAKEKQKLETALQVLQKNGEVELEWLAEANVSAFQNTLRKGFHVIHFIGHGAAEWEGQSGVLFFTKEDGTSEPLPADTLAMYLRDSAIRFVFLNACESASTHGNIAKLLVERGVRAAIGMQTVVADPVAIALAAEFYAALVDGWPIDAALVEGRRAVVRATRSNIEAPDWVQPVLYMRSIQDCDLFHRNI